MDLGMIALVLVSMLWISQTIYVSSHSSDPNNTYDVIIFAATPAGFAAALAAKATGANRVLLLEPSAHVGGMASPGGIGLRDCEHNEVRTNNSTQYAWAMRNAEYYGVKEPVWQPDNWLGERTFLEMLNESGVELRLNTTFVEGSAGIRTSRDSSGLWRIAAIRLESGEWLECRYVIDASYEGEVMVSSGHVTYTYGRESEQQYNESLGGVSAGSIGQFQSSIDPYYHVQGKDGTKSLLKWVQDGLDPRSMLGEADDNLMAYSFRACLTNDTSKMVNYTKPPGYNPDDFELPRRYIKTYMEQNRTIVYPWNSLDYKGYPVPKLDACCGSSPIGIDAAGLAVGYASGSRAERKVIYDLHKYYVQGLMWFWATDPIVPEDIKKEINSLGLCADEWPDNDHFPPQLYVREAARIVGDKVFTQNDRIPANDTNGCLSDSIAIGSWAYDIHEMQRVAVTDVLSGERRVYNEGLTRPNTGGVYFFEIPYYILLPKRQEMVNLAVPNCPSVSHVAFSGIREEPTLWQLGQAAGTAAGIALQHGEGMALQDVDHRELQDALVEQDAFVHWPPRGDCEIVPDGEEWTAPEPHSLPDGDGEDHPDSNLRADGGIAPKDANYQELWETVDAYFDCLQHNDCKVSANNRGRRFKS